MKVFELEGAELDAWVARALGKERVIVSDGRACQEAKIPFLPPGFVMHGALPEYSKDWTQGGPIIERERISLIPPDSVGSFDEWKAFAFGSIDCLTSKQPLVAAMRAFVASKFGDEVSGE